MSEPKTVRCVRCESEFTDEELAGVTDCPTCGTTSIPCAIAEDVAIRINWHELRILTIFADNWAGVCEDRDPGKDTRVTVRAIVRRLEAQYRDRTPLSILGELKRAQEHGIVGDAELISASGEREILPARKPS